MPRKVQRVLGRTRAIALSAALMSGAALVSGVALPGAGLWAGTASALPGPSCSSDSGRTTCTFSYTGAATDWAVPAGVTALYVVANGGSGARARTTDPRGGGTGGKVAITRRR